MVVRKHLPILAFAWVTVLDVAITLPFWHLEGNDVVLTLGPMPFVAVKIGGVLAACMVWYVCRVYRTTVGVSLAVAYSLLLALAVVSNILVVVWPA